MNGVHTAFRHTDYGYSVSKRIQYLAKFLPRNANAMSDNSKECVYAIITKYDRHNRTDRFSYQNHNAGENNHECV